MQRLRVFTIVLALLACAVVGVAQTPEPSPTPLSAELTPTPTPPAEIAKEQAELAANIKQLQELKTQNEEILKQQQATLDALDELEKAAEQIRIYSKRG